MAIISIFMPGEIGRGDFSVLLKRQTLRTDLNAGGTVFSETAAAGWFEGNVAQAIDEQCHAVLSRGGIPFYGGEISVGETTIRHFERDLTKPTAAQIDMQLSGTHGGGSWLTGDGGGGGGSGPGPINVGIVVNDGAANLEGVVVRMKADVVNDYQATTVAGTGLAEFDLPAGTYRLSMCKAGYSFDAVDVVVIADVELTHSMTAETIPQPTIIGRATGRLQINENAALAGAGVPVTVRLTKGPGTAGIGQLNHEWTVVTDASSNADFVNLVQGATYELWIGSEDVNTAGKITFICPATATFLINEVVGNTQAG